MKRQTFKKLGAFILVISMLLSLNLNMVLAETIDASGRDLDHEISLTIHKFEADDQIEFPDSDGTDSHIIPDGVRPVEGVDFIVERVVIKTEAAAGSIDPDDYEADIYNPLVLHGTTDANGELTFSTAANTNFTQGIYKVTEVKSANPATKPVPVFLVSLPMLHPNSNDENLWIYDVHVYPKNDIRTPIEKESVEEGTFGNIIRWQYSIIVPEDIQNPVTGLEHLAITDRLDYRLLYANNIRGWYIDRNGIEHDLVESSDFTATLYTADMYDDDGNPIEAVTISLLQNAFVKLSEMLMETGDETPTLFFEFDTIINIDAIGTPNLEDIANGGTLEYTNSIGYEYDNEEIEEPDMPVEEVFGIEIFKTDVSGNQFLEGATFKIYTQQEGGTALKDPTNPIVDWEISTGIDGLAYFNGLVAGTYYIEETVAPEGFNILNNRIEVIVNGESGSQNHLISILVTNSKDFTLPTTGGVGTILFTIGGASLIGISVIAIMAMRGRVKED